MESVVLDLKSLYGDAAKIASSSQYIEKALETVGGAQEVILTGAAPVWLYLRVAHALSGKATRLVYRSQVTGDVPVFDNDVD